MTRIQVGKIISTHGIAGEVKVWPYNQDKKFYEQLTYVYLDDEEKPNKIISVRPFKNTYLFKLEGLNSIEIAKKHINAVLSLDETDMPQLKDGHYYFYQLIDMDVQTPDGIIFGKLEEVVQGAVNDILVIRNNEGKEWLIPSVENFIKAIDMNNHRLTVTTIEGMSNED